MVGRHAAANNQGVTLVAVEAPRREPRPPRATNRIAGETEAKPLSNHAIRDGQEHAREDIMTDILRAVQPLDAAAALIAGVLRGGKCRGGTPMPR
jgi:hypothetical protein